jgi:hypothetical protein
MPQLSYRSPYFPEVRPLNLPINCKLDWRINCKLHKLLKDRIVTFWMTVGSLIVVYQCFTSTHYMHLLCMLEKYGTAQYHSAEEEWLIYQVRGYLMSKLNSMV